MNNIIRHRVAIIGLGFALSTASLPTLASAVSDQLLIELQQVISSAAEVESSTNKLIFNANAGKKLWFSDNNGRSCTSCHTQSVFSPGQHQRTGKHIAAMAPSVNPDRLTQRKKILKWLLRNCKWTLGRECSAQEKGDILLWLSAQ